MKIDPHRTNHPKMTRSGSVSRCFTAPFEYRKHWFLLVFSAAAGLWYAASITSADDTTESAASNSEISLPAASATSNSSKRSAQQAATVLNRAILQLANGPAFDAKLRETVWTSGRSVMARGRYEQAGQGTGRYNMQLKLIDSDGKHSMQQISDGRLAWKRTEIAGEITITRVNLGALNEAVRLAGRSVTLSPKLRVGGLIEMLDTIKRDYDLSLHLGALNENKVLMITGDLNDTARARILTESGRTTWPELCPSFVRLAIAIPVEPPADADAGQPMPADAAAGLPIRFEYCAEPILASTEQDGETVTKQRRPTIALFELFSIQQINPPPISRFEFQRSDADVNFIDETARYVEPYGLQMTDLQRKRLRR